MGSSEEAFFFFFFLSTCSVVKKTEMGYPVKFSIYDYDRFTANDFMATGHVPVSAFLKEPVTEKEIHLETKKQDGFDRARLVISGHFQSFSELKKQFWRKLAENFDVNEDHAIDEFEFMTMLDTLNTTVTSERVTEMVGFFLSLF